MQLEINLHLRASCLNWSNSNVVYGFVDLTTGRPGGNTSFGCPLSINQSIHRR